MGFYVDPGLSLLDPSADLICHKCTPLDPILALSNSIGLGMSLYSHDMFANDRANMMWHL